MVDVIYKTGLADFLIRLVYADGLFPKIFL